MISLLPALTCYLSKLSPLEAEYFLYLAGPCSKKFFSAALGGGCSSFDSSESASDTVSYSELG